MMEVENASNRQLLSVCQDQAAQVYALILKSISVVRAQQEGAETVAGTITDGSIKSAQQPKPRLVCRTANHHLRESPERSITAV